MGGHRTRGPQPLELDQGASKLLAAEFGPRASTAARDYLEIIGEEILRLDNILVNFQLLTRPMTISKEPISVNETIRRTVTLAEIAALPGRRRGLGDLERTIQNKIRSYGL